eukprot:m.14598 g.14598  ORF g.14598 m.14598 type:complete len:51 (-) comp6369_c0_seq1:98-250(-)
MSSLLACILYNACAVLCDYEDVREKQTRRKKIKRRKEKEKKRQSSCTVNI